MTAIERAEELLAAATAESPECTCTDPETMHESECPWVKWLYAQPEAQRQLVVDGPEFLRGYIGAIKALGGLMEIAETAMPDSYFRSDRRTKKARKSITDFKRLFPEPPASAD